jgi:putative membrane protein
LEIRSSELALQKSQTAAVKQFAQMMINDHTTASKNLMAAADQDGVTVPAEMLPKHASQVKALSGADGGRSMQLISTPRWLLTRKRLDS